MISERRECADRFTGRLEKAETQNVSRKSALSSGYYRVASWVNFHGGTAHVFRREPHIGRKFRAGPGFYFGGRYRNQEKTTSPCVRLVTEDGEKGVTQGKRVPTRRRSYPAETTNGNCPVIPRKNARLTDFCWGRRGPLQEKGKASKGGSIVDIAF